MKNHVIIPIFIPHLGCENDCVFCNQKTITAREEAPTSSDLFLYIENYLKYFIDKDYKIEIGFFGGSFTGIPEKDQLDYLNIAKSFKDSGQVHEIRLSTRPDYIDSSILNNLKSLSVDTIELGIQSFYDDVLLSSKRGHTSNDSTEACKLIKDYGFKLGIQLMIGLPNDTTEKSINSARIASKFNPEYSRIYPTLVLDDTYLAIMYQNGLYTPPLQEEMIFTAKEMYKILFESGSYILRVGLKSTDNINPNADLTKGYHPAFRQIVEGEIAKEILDKEIKKLPKDDLTYKELVFESSPKSFNNMIGHKGVNKKYFEETYPHIKIKYKENPKLQNGIYSCDTI